MLCLETGSTIRRLELLPALDRPDPPAAGVHVWRADLDEPGWPGPEDLPEDERRRAEALLRPLSRRRWVASRWALRGVLCRYLRRAPEEIRLATGEHGKPRLAEPAAGLSFNLSHSDRMAVIAVAQDREVGVDVERVAARHPRGFYERWADREARLKCLGTGLTGSTPPQEVQIELLRLDLDPGFAASLGVTGPPPAVRGWTFEPTAPVRRNRG
jgi:4'-phosphopantetheinyl transferase